MSELALTLNSRLVASRNQVSCDLAGEAAILNLKSGVYFGLDPIGARVWKALLAPVTLDQLCIELAQEYDVQRETLEADLRELIQDLVAHGLVEVVE